LESYFRPRKSGTHSGGGEEGDWQSDAPGHCGGVGLARVSLDRNSQQVRTIKKDTKQLSSPKNFRKFLHWTLKIMVYIKKNEGKKKKK